jgi:HAD superfamily hydrolase (TIGR01509 family)
MTTRAWDQRDELVPRGFPGLRRGRLLRRRRTRPGLQAVLWDMDGLLVDTEPVWTVAEEELAERLGGTWSDELKARIAGTRLDASVPMILEWYGVEATPQVVSETSAWLLDRMVELFKTEVRVLPGVTELLAELQHEEVPQALVSSSYRVLVDAALNVLGKDTFDATVAGDEVTATKPAPDPYLLAAEQLGVDPHLCLVLEDSMAGVESALAAGCRCILVPTFSPDVIPEGVDVHPTLERVDLIGLIHAMGRFRSSEDAS